jgi:prevent-host-death family protein
MRRVGVEEARVRLAELLDGANRGTATVITKRGRPYAALVPLERAQGRRRSAVLSLKGTGRGLWGEDSRRTIGALRDEWR